MHIPKVLITILMVILTPTVAFIVSKAIEFGDYKWAIAFITVYLAMAGLATALILQKD